MQFAWRHASLFLYFFTIFSILAWGALPHRPPGYLAEGAKPPQTCNGNPSNSWAFDCKFMSPVIIDLSVMTCANRVLLWVRSNCLLRGVYPFPLHRKPENMKSDEKSNENCENSRIFQIFQFCSILGVFQGNLRQLGGVFGLSRSILAASWGVLEASWRLLGGS